MSDLMKGVAFVVFGVAEGYVFFKTGLLNPQAVMDQMKFSSFIVMKLFLSAVGTSMVAQSIMSVVAKDEFEKTRKYSKTAVGYPRAVGGCALLGVGMALAGSGPTLIPGQLGAGGSSALNVFLGALTGGLIFGILEPSFFSTNIACPKGEKTSVDLKMGVSYFKVAAPLGLLLLSAAYGLEVVFPHSEDPISRASGQTMLPFLAGMVVGLNQLPLRFLSGKGQGGSSSVMNIIATATNGAVSPRFKLTSILSASQLLYVYVGTAAGAYLAAAASSPTAAAAVPTAARAFAGGVLMLLGSRIADGCTCGHGISGFSELSVQSIAAAAAIFAGGIATAAVLA
mmetsp:Transcript_9049/g.19437  ORF Transcript_9049/g.19437 Transcript_9049/m.19437 type:complete len:340 (-) Transcript_9049:21-1040(-)